VNSNDANWVSKQIATLPHPEYKKKAWAGYRATFKKAFDGEPECHRKDNVARSVANCALRDFIKRVNKNLTPE